MAQKTKKPVKKQEEIKVEKPQQKTITKKAQTNTTKEPKSKVKVDKYFEEPKKEQVVEAMPKATPVVEKKETKVEAKPKAAPVVDKKETVVEEKKPLKVLFVASESNPFIKTGGLADVAGALPKALKESNVDARVILPLYMDIPQEYRVNMKFIGNCYVTLAWRYQYCGVFSYVYEGVTYYFIDNEGYFKRHGLYGHFDDGERFAFFSKAVLECLRIIGFAPDVIHCNDWHTALVPVFLDCFYRGVQECKNIKTVFTIHNIEFQGQYGDGLIGDILGLNYEQSLLVRYKDCANYMKGGIESANKVTTVSATYANEILDPFYGFGLQDILKARQFKLQGIINGIDTKKNDPSVDKALFKNYSVNSLEDKVYNKTGLQELLGLPVNADVPLIGMVGRLTHQKGIDLVTAVMDKILSKNVQMVVLGTGDTKYENILKDMQARFPGKLRAIISFSSDMASKIYAGSDMFLMPSKFEPCGLSQMLAMRYASVPIVRETGGLKDTVIPYNHVDKTGNGFTFKTYNAFDMLDAVERAVGLYYDYRYEWDHVVENGAKEDFSWDTIAKKYIDLYESL